MSVIERVAEAMADEQGSNWEALQENGPGAGLRGMYIRLAREAVRAMHKFTPEMESVAIEAVCLLDGKEARWAWEAVIESALKEEL